MSENHHPPLKAYRNAAFIDSPEARPIRILSEYLEPEARFADFHIHDTIVFFGSSRLVAADEAARLLAAARRDGGDPRKAERLVAMARYYEDARQLAHRLTAWSKGLEGTRRRFVVCTGGGPGIMEAANRGASEARGVNVGLNISLPFEQEGNPYITRELAFEFHYFFLRKFWFIYLAKGLVIFPGGFGTLDEFFEVMTLIQTGKLHKRMPVVLFGTEYWSRVLDFEAMIEAGMADRADLDLFRRTDSVEDAFSYITRELEKALADPGGRPELT